MHANSYNTSIENGNAEHYLFPFTNQIAKMLSYRKYPIMWCKIQTKIIQTQAAGVSAWSD
jgi:hypothetical protein